MILTTAPFVLRFSKDEHRVFQQNRKWRKSLEHESKEW
jgi:hypothetical protein